MFKIDVFSRAFGCVIYECIEFEKVYDKMFSTILNYDIIPELNVDSKINQLASLYKK